MTLSNESTERIALLYRVAKRNGSLITVQELTRLLPEITSESEMKDAMASVPFLNSMFELRSGFLTERFGDPPLDPVVLEAASRRAARANLIQASRFVSFLHNSGFQVVAVSGSTSYGSASVSKDTDLFCVAPSRSMWICLTKSLVLARAYGLVNRGTSRICISCVMDEGYAREAFGSRRHPLFARDAIEAKVLVGRARYESLLRTASWISDYYPIAYKEIFTGCRATRPQRDPSSFAKALNRLLYLGMGTYLLAKSSLLNLRFKKQGRIGDAFSVRCGEDHLIYESRRYLDMKKEYEAADSRLRTTSKTLHRAARSNVLPTSKESPTSELA